MSFYDYTVLDRQGNDFSLEAFRGKVVLVVNTATGCGFTPHYKPLEAMYEKYRERGFEILDIPCNQFNGQTPGTDEEIHAFCTLRYNTQFPQMKKSDVNGENELPLYTFLKGEKGFEGFGKFLQVVGVQLGVVLVAMLALVSVQHVVQLFADASAVSGFDAFGLLHDDVGVHHDETAVGVIHETGVVGLLDEARDGLRAKTDIQDGVHHAGH